jgi:hypothetical protein
VFVSQRNIQLVINLLQFSQFSGNLVEIRSRNVRKFRKFHCEIDDEVGAVGRVQGAGKRHSGERKQ